MNNLQKKYLYSVLVVVFKNYELTRIPSLPNPQGVRSFKFILNKWRPDMGSVEINSDLCSILIESTVLEITSGNFHTGESHFQLNKEKLIEKLKNDTIFQESLNYRIESIKHLYREYQIDALI